MSLPSLGAWIETSMLATDALDVITSLPSLGAWIETSFLWSCSTATFVAPFIGSVD